MLEELRIQNFQSHSKLAIQFDENITTIVGPSDVGKSAVIRSLRWICRNHPQGDQFIKEGTKGTTVQLIADGRAIKRRRGKSDNSYHLDGEEYRAFGNDVPDTIKKILNLDDVNFQVQVYNPREPINSQPTFWFSLSAGEVSRQLNSVVDLGIIDNSLSAIAKKVRYYQQAVQVSRDRLQKAKEEKEKLDWVQQADSDLQAVESIEAEKASVSASVETLEKAVGDAKQQKKVQHRTSSQAEQARQVGLAGRDAKKAFESRKRLELIVYTLNEQKEKLEKERQRPDISPLEGIVTEYNKVSERKERLSEALEDLESARKKRERKQKEKDDAHKELEEKTEGLCPICGSEMEI